MTIPGIFSQRDSRWSAQELGFNTDPYYNLYHFGCAVAGAANLLWWITGDASWTPARVNQWSKDNGGYAPGGGLIIWGKLAQLMSGFNVSYHGFTTNLGDTNNFLAPEASFAIAQLTGPGFPMHFSAMPYVGQIADSWDARLKPVGSYHFVGAHLFSHDSPHVVVPPVEVVPVQAPVLPPLVAAAPEPVATNAAPQPDPNPAQVVAVTPPPIVPDTVLNDLPQMFEYEETYKPFSGGPKDVLLKTETAAIDMTATKPPIHLVASKPYGPGGPFRSAGTMQDGGRTYYRGTSGSWFGVPADDVAESVADPTPLPAADPETVTFGMFLKNPLGTLIRLIFR